MSFWKETLADQTISHLPADFVRPSPPRNVESVLQEPHSGVSSNDLLTAFIILASKLTGDTDISVGTKDDRGRPFVLRVKDLNLAGTFADAVESVTEACSASVAAWIPIDDVLKLLGSGSDTAPLYHLRYLGGTETAEGLLGSSDLDVDLTLFHFRDSLAISYNSLLFSSQRIRIIAKQLISIVSFGRSTAVSVGAINLIEETQRSILPDPTRDLHWNSFVGPISTIFAENAIAQPERPCVVVSTASGGELTFSYDHIHKRSNELANHLIQQGIVKGDVVVIYAFRGVDLVIAVMGILKAGATFSVIDPAYPPERQCIYLSVARPRGLIVLERAGTLDEHVTDWIASNLDPLTVKLPALRIEDDGTRLRGLPEQISSDRSAVDIGPDDIPTLSFTSGSEGVPKGVRGRHFSLTYYFPWMAEHFGLSAADRFTMLSGIAHDPIQRDIFTPLFLGATLVVPTAEDIGTPGRLAEWCAKKKVTVTHLTPAMGQLLSSQVAGDVQIDSLRNAFFVGDVLTKRDVNRLQSLGRNVDIINMYGTTETQRSVSFYRIPAVARDPNFLASCKDIMPAGQGMKDVQLLVVSRDGSRRVCGVGEIGEIFVRAGGLAEGYLSLPEMTAQKFVQSWFVNDSTWSSLIYDGAGAWRGARDRLYRSGDLGRYLPDGNVECSGRADDQVKIRGFRIELGEIDTHLSRHPLVRENVTLLRRNKDEEPTLVSYFVPDQKPELENLLRATPLKRLTVLISGSGSNLQALIDATKSGILAGKAEITTVISNRKDAFGLQRAEQAGIRTKVWSLAKSRKQFGDSRERYDIELAKLVLEDGKPDLVVCAGFMHILSTQFLEPLEAASVGIINLHPALPGQFNGAKAIERAFEAFQQGLIECTGIMIHWVTAEVDMGEPVLVRKVEIHQGEAIEALEQRIHSAEHEAIVQATADVLANQYADLLVQRMQRYRPLVDDIRAYLKTKLATYAVPSVYVPMDKMPLNPNGKIDKPRLPYPDTAQLAAVSRGRRGSASQLNGTQRKMVEVWRDVLPAAPADLSLSDNFFDLGGHSILATKLIFKLRAAFVLDNIPLGLIFATPTLGQLSDEIDKLRQGETADTAAQPIVSCEPAYADDAEELCRSVLAKSFETREPFSAQDRLTIFLTGATGFLGAFLMRDLLERRQTARLVVHVRAKESSAGMIRIRDNLTNYGVWKEDWESRIDIVCGDLSADRLGLTPADWTRLASEVDIVIHNGALVHWVFPYAQLRPANVLGTMSTLQLCAEGKAKVFTFVSSTSVLDTEHFVRESDRLVNAGESGVSESDDLAGSRTGLGTGYGQSKWAGEFIAREAGRRGLRGTVVRPGYIVSDSRSGVVNTDDFIIRLIKGCTQIGSFPDIHNNVNMVPVDHVARVTVACALHPPSEALLSVAQVTGHPRSRFVDFLGLLADFGFDVQRSDYVPWKVALEREVSRTGENALLPLLHFVTEDLPSSTKAPELDDRNAVEALRIDAAAEWTGQDKTAGAGFLAEEMSKALSFLVAVNFLDAPRRKAKLVLPQMSLDQETKERFARLGGRGSAAK
ncbi:large subunit of alpha-aminoadipate reductase [Savitreella phatthalungensis]